MRSSWEQKTNHGRWGLVSPDHRAAFRWEGLEAGGGRQLAFGFLSALCASVQAAVEEAALTSFYCTRGFNRL